MRDTCNFIDGDRADTLHQCIQIVIPARVHRHTLVEGDRLVLSYQHRLLQRLLTAQYQRGLDLTLGFLNLSKRNVTAFQPLNLLVGCTLDVFKTESRLEFMLKIEQGWIDMVVVAGICLGDRLVAFNQSLIES